MNTDFRGLWLLAGAWVAAYFTLPAWVLWCSLALLVLLLALLLRARHDQAHSAPWFSGPLILLLGLIAVSMLGLSNPPCQLPAGSEQQRRAVVSFQDPASAQGARRRPVQRKSNGIGTRTDGCNARCRCT